MKLNILKSIIGISMVCSHFGAMLFVLVLGTNYFTFDQALDVILILAPLFGAFTLAIVSDFIRNREKKAKGPSVNAPFVFITLFLPSVYVIAVFGLIAAWPLEWITSIDQLKRGVAVCETVVGASLGLVIGSLFDLRVQGNVSSVQTLGD